MDNLEYKNLPPLPDYYNENLLLRLISSPGTTGNEGPIAELIRNELIAVGVPAESIVDDQANKRISVPTPCGNLIVKLKGSHPGRPLLFSTHMDTVPLCDGAVPEWVKDKNQIRSKGKTALGGDNRTGCAVLIQLAARLLRQEGIRPNITLLFTVREESGLHGARHLDTSLLGNPSMGFNVDGGEPAKFIRGAVGAERWEAHIEGIASHAGVHPDKGASATLVASLAISEVHRGGWFGKVVREGRQGSSNVGILSGRNGGTVGDATNVVTDYLHMRGESRSFDSDFVRKITQAYENALVSAANEVKTNTGQTAKVEFHSHIDYEAFLIPEDSAIIQKAFKAANKTGLSPKLELGRGGLDSNWIVKHGIQSLTFGAGQHEIHTIAEYVDMAEFKSGCDLALELALGD